MKRSIRTYALISLSIISFCTSSCMSLHELIPVDQTPGFFGHFSSWACRAGNALSGLVGKVGLRMPNRFSDLCNYHTALGAAATIGAGWYAGNWLRNKLARRNPTVPIVYDPGYNISFFGVEKLHPFDT